MTILRTALVAMISSVFLAIPAGASAHVVWDLRSDANTTAAPGEMLTFVLRPSNIGDVATIGTSTVKASLPPGTIYVSSTPVASDWSCAGTPVGASVVNCTLTESLPPLPFGPLGPPQFAITVWVDPDTSVSAGVRTVHFEVSGGGPDAAPDTTDDPTRVTGEPLEFGVDAFDALAANAAGYIDTRAGGHPSDYTTWIDFNRGNSPLYGAFWPVEPVRDIAVDLPPGFIGNPSSIPQCAAADLAFAENIIGRPKCPVGSQIGVVIIKGANGDGKLDLRSGPLSLFNMEPPDGAPARFGFTYLGNVVVLDAYVRSGGDYGITVEAKYNPEALAVGGSEVIIWGMPADPMHDSQRTCPGEKPLDEGGPTCKAEDAGLLLTPLLRNPTSCTAPGKGLATTLHGASWQNPGEVKEGTSISHEAPGYPKSPSQWGPPVGIEDCGQVPFSPSLSVQPTSNAADAPTGLDVELEMPQQGLTDPGAISEADLRTARVKLPPGMSVNPSAAAGLGACTASQIGLTTPIGSTPIHFDTAPALCPSNSKIGTVRIETPLLGTTDSDAKGTLEGSVYLAAQQDNPFGSLLAMYLVVDDARTGLVLKLPGRIEADPSSGQLETVFDDNPQLPFSRLHLELFGGSRAALRTPGCGTHTVSSSLTPWSGAPAAHLSNSFEITQGCGGGFDPRLNAGTANPLAATTSPFSLRLWREDASQELGDLQVTLPPGLSGYLTGIPYCPDGALAAVSAELGEGRAQEASSACPAASRVGSVAVGAGAGPKPFFTTAGRVYLAGPYRGAPLSLAVITPAVAGPFDLGSVVVRNALRVDPTTAQITVQSDPLPRILHGIPLDLRDIRVHVDRDRFTLNPTSCEPMRIDSSIHAVSGSAAAPSVPFQVGNCASLAFKPRLSLKLRGATKRSGHPALTAIFRPRQGDANASRVQVALPHSEFLAQSHIRTICTRVQFAADACPKGSIYGRATAVTPILDQPLTGSIYLRSSDNPLPNIVLKLKGPPSQPIEIDAVGRIDSHKGGIRTTFAQIPDAPLTKVTMRLPAGKRSLLENSTNICRGKHHAKVRMAAHNGRYATSRVPLRAKCPKKRRHHRRHGAPRGHS